MGLLVPEKLNGRFVFSDADAADLVKVLQLKEKDFTLTEVKKILIFQRLGGMNTRVYRKLYGQYLAEKVEKLTERIQRDVHTKAQMQSEMEALEETVLIPDDRFGVPFHFIPKLKCPVCHRRFTIHEGIVKQNHLIKAGLLCECGYSLDIENGIIIDRGAVREKMLHGQPMPTKEEYLDSCSYPFVNYLYQSMVHMMQRIEASPDLPKAMLEVAGCVGFFLMQYHHLLSPETTYVLVDYDLSRIRALQEEISLSSRHTNFLFLCCDYDHIPLEEGCVDKIVDFNVLLDELDENWANQLLPLLMDEGEVIGSVRMLDGMDPLRWENALHDWKLKVTDQLEIDYPKEIQTTKERERSRIIYVAKNMGFTQDS